MRAGHRHRQASHHTRCLEEPRWKPWLALALDHGYRGCWSFPIETSTGRLVGSFAMYFAEPRDATPADLTLAQAATQTAAIIISHHQENEKRRQTEATLRGLNDTIGQPAAERTEALRWSEDALRQSQKMEAVGQLTGGLAHDFNNMLAGISSNLKLMSICISQGRLRDVEKYLVAAQGASKRAAALTHRLPAFSRQQALEPKATDVNAMATAV